MIRAPTLTDGSARIPPSFVPSFLSLTFGSLHHRILSRANLLSAAAALLKVRLSAKWPSQRIRNGRFRLSPIHAHTQRVALVWRRQAMIVKPLQKTTFGTGRRGKGLGGGREGRYSRTETAAAAQVYLSVPFLSFFHSGFELSRRHLASRPERKEKVALLLPPPAAITNLNPLPSFRLSPLFLLQFCGGDVFLKESNHFLSD